MSEKVWRGRLGDFPAFSTPDDFGEQDQVVLSHAADYDALQARVEQLEGNVQRQLESAIANKEKLGDLARLESNAITQQARIATLEASLVEKTAECERLQTERDDAAHETAGMIEFLGVHLNWEYFWAEGFLGKETASLAEKNAQSLRRFLDEKGWGIKAHGSLRAERDTALAELATARAECERLNGNCYTTLHIGISDNAKEVAGLHDKLDVAVILTRLGSALDTALRELATAREAGNG